MPDSTVRGPFVDVKRWAVNYAVQRNITRDYGLELGKAGLQIDVLKALVEARDSSLRVANAELILWKHGYRERGEEIGQCEIRVKRSRRWLLPVAVGGVIGGFVLGRL